MATMTLAPARERVIALEQPPAQVSETAEWLTAAVEALQAFRVTH